jgi:uncharacterized membrane protein
MTCSPEVGTIARSCDGLFFSSAVHMSSSSVQRVPRNISTVRVLFHERLWLELANHSHSDAAKFLVELEPEDVTGVKGMRSGIGVFYQKREVTSQITGVHRLKLWTSKYYSM